MPDAHEHAVIDRIVEGQAVLLVGPGEAEEHVPVPALPPDAGEGDRVLLARHADGTLAVVGVDHERTAAERDALGQRLERLRRERSTGRFARDAGPPDGS